MYNQTLKHGLKVAMTTKSVEVFNINTGEKYEDKNEKSTLAAAATVAAKVVPQSQLKESL